MFCVYCGNPVPEHAETCPNCHRPVMVPPPPQPADSPAAESTAGQTATVTLPETQFSFQPQTEIPAVDLPETREIPVVEPQAETQFANLTDVIIMPPAPMTAAPPVEDAGFEISQPRTAATPDTLPFRIPPQQAASPMPPKPARSHQKISPLKIILILLGLGLVCILAAVVIIFLTRPAWLPFDLPALPSLSRSANHPAFLVAYPNRQGEKDIEWNDGQEPILLMKDVVENRSDLRTPVYFQDGEPAYAFWYPAEFIPGTDMVLIRTLDGDELRTLVVNPDAKEVEPVEIFASSQPYQPYLLDDGTIAFIETRDESKRAYVSHNYAEAERVLKEDDLLFLPALQQWIAVDRDNDGESVTYRLYSLDGEEIAILYQGAPVRSHAVSPTGAYLSLIVPTDIGEKLVLVDLRTRKETSSLDGYAAISAVGFAEKSDLAYFIAEDSDGWLTLGATLDGNWQIMAEKLSQLTVVVSPDRDRMAYLTMNEEEDTYQIYTVDVEQAQVKNVYESNDPLTLLQTFTSIPVRFFVEQRTADDEVSLLSIGFDGDEALVLFKEDQVSDLNYRVWSSYILVDYRMNGSQYLWVCTPYDEDGFLLLEDWQTVTVHDLLPDDHLVVFSAREESDDEIALYVTALEENGSPRKLDDSDFTFGNAFVMPDKKSVLYTARIDSNEDASEVRQALLDGSEKPAVIAGDALLLSTGWQYRDTREYGMLYPAFPYEGSGSETLQANQVYTFEMETGIQEVQYTLRYEPNLLYDVAVKAANDTALFDPVITALNKDGVELRSADWDTGIEETLLFSPVGDNSGMLQIINNLEHTSPVAFDLYVQSIPVTPIEPGSTVSGENSKDAFLGAPWADEPFYVDVYSIQAKTPMEFTITVKGDPDVTHYAYLLDESITFVDGVFEYEDGELTFDAVIAQAGTYYLFVADLSDAFDGTLNEALDHRYQIILGNASAEAPVEEAAAETEAPIAANTSYSIGLVTDAGGIDDQGYNQAAWNGLQRIAERYGCEVDYIESASFEDYARNIELFAASGYDAIVTISWAMLDSTETAANLHPEVQFVGIDQVPFGTGMENYLTAKFDEWKMGFEAGALAAALSNSGIIAGVYGTDIVPAIVSYAEGYEDGARYMNPDIEVINTFHPGEIAVAFTDDAWGAETARSAIGQDADVIFGVGGSTADGALIETAQYDDLYCLGADIDQWQTLPEAHSCMVSSIIRDVENTVFQLVSQIMERGLMGGEREGVIDLTSFHQFPSQLTNDEIAMLEEIDIKLADGQLTYEDFH